jgi:DNA-binding IclR family transcriptional regulator
MEQNPPRLINKTTYMAMKTSPPRVLAPEHAPAVSRYRAPALEKGLDVIELLAAEKSPLNLSAISHRLGRSSGELFRMLQVLEFKGFITVSDNGTGYVLTNKLFALAMAQAPVRSLVETALPVMRKLVQDIGQSCHIAAEDFIARANAVRSRGHHEAASDFVRGIVDLSAPILRGDTAVAALTIPFVHSNPLVMEMPQAVEHVRAAARQISNEIVHGDFP